MRPATTEHLLARLADALATSDLLRAVASVRRDGGRGLALGDTPLRPLAPEEVARLESQGCSAGDWARVLVADGFVPSRVRNTEFQGDVILGRFAGSAAVGGRELPAGVFNSTLVDSVVGHEALVRDVRLLAGYVVGPGAILLDCGGVVCESETTFGNGAVLSLGIESGGRPVPVYAEIDVEMADAVARPCGRHQWLDLYKTAVEEYAARSTSERGIIEAGARIQNTPRLQNSYVGPRAVVQGATHVEDSTLLSSAEEVTRVDSGACVSGSLLQWGSRVSTLAVVHCSVLTEHSHAERHGKVTNSILGPNTAVGAGEVTACLLGPFVAAHHQSLLIAALWPAGRGNVGYGACAGSNHTSRAPDQEFRPGEGMFLGLGVNVKFPADFSRAPYTVVACSTTLLPQKVTFPFALITPPSSAYAGISPAYNEIIPGWMLSDNFYALKRNEVKWRSRNQARRSRFDFAVLRPDTVDLMRDACRRLMAVATVKDVYTDADVEGLGKNFLTEPSRRQAVEAYRLAIRYYALLGLAERVRVALQGSASGAEDLLLSVPCRDLPWEHQRTILVEEVGLTDVASGLGQLPALLGEVAHRVEAARARDDRRGPRIIDDYTDAHVTASEDPLVRQTWEETRRLQAEVEALRRDWDAFGVERAAPLLKVWSGGSRNRPDGEPLVQAADVPAGSDQLSSQLGKSLALRQHQHPEPRTCLPPSSIPGSVPSAFV